MSRIASASPGASASQSPTPTGPAAPPPAAPPPPPHPTPIDYARPIFVENQRFTQWWAWLILIIPPALAIGVLTYYAARLSPWSYRVRSMLPAMALSFATPTLFFLLRLNVVLTGQRLTVRFLPIRRRIDVANIASFRVLTYTIRDFGGWGIKWARDGSLVLNVSGNRAIRINRKVGKALIIGTQRVDDFARALEELGVKREPD